MPPSAAGPQFRFETSYFDQLPGFYVPCDPMPVADPVLLKFNRELADELGIGGDLSTQRAAAIFSGGEKPEGARPVAQAYAGHQFGGFVPQLGDGRALLLGELTDRHGRRRDIAFKGSGPTPFSRGGDGKAAVGPVLREYLIGEAMHALGIPTTRGLAAVGTGEVVARERPLPGAILTRVAASHVRVGTFEFFAARGRPDQVRQLADFVIARHYPCLEDEADRYLLLLRAVGERQAALIVQWMLVGFIHGVMNTDNMAISGETIDYGPCAFMESTDSNAVFSSIDSGGRYAYGNQPTIACWNLARLAETLLPLIDEQDPDRAIVEATQVIEGFMPHYESLKLASASAKLGLTVQPSGIDSGDAGNTGASADTGDAELIRDWFELLERHSVDFTLAWRRLADAADGHPRPLVDLFPSPVVVQPWLERWHRRVASAPAAQVAASIRGRCPLYLPRNHLVEDALAAASDRADLKPFERLLRAVTDPFEERAELETYAQPAPPGYTESYKTFCGT